MLDQINIYGNTMVEEAIERIQNFAEMFGKDEGYFIAFSGGKDSVVIKKLADMAGVRYDAHYSVTSVDPPELVQFIKREYPDVIFEKHRYKKDGKFVKAGQQITMWNLIPEKSMPPTRIARYCCESLKESAGDGRLTMTGVRWAESHNRKQNQGLITIMYRNKKLQQELEEMGANFTPTARGGGFDRGQRNHKRSCRVLLSKTENSFKPNYRLERFGRVGVHTPLQRAVLQAI